MDLNSIDLNKIAVFCTVIDAGGYQRAAEVLHVTPSALSQTITRLEHSLGLSLFDRRGRRLVPTKEGLRIHQEFLRHQTGFVRAVQALQGRQTEVAGTLRIGAYLEFAKSRLTGVMKDFIGDHPEANIKVVFDSPSRLHRMLDLGQLDLCLSIFPSSSKKSVRSKAFSEEELVLIAQAHILPENPAMKQILSVPVVDYYYNHQPIGRWLQLHFGRRPKKPPVRIFAATAEMVLALVRAGAGIGVVPKYLVTAADIQSGIKIVRPTSRKLTDYIWLLERIGSEKSALHLAFTRKLMPARRG